MIEQNNNQLILTFPTADSATTFAAFLRSLFNLSPGAEPAAVSSPASGLLPVPLPTPTPDSPEPVRSRHAVLTPERQDQLFNQRQQGETSHQRILRAQTVLRDGALPFRALQQAPRPSGQASPRMRAQAEGGFADGSGDLPEAGRRKTRLRASSISPEPSQS